MHSLFRLRNYTLRKTGLFSACALFAASIVPTSLYATPAAYTLTLTPGASSLYGGTGSIVIADAPSFSGISDYTASNGTLENLTFTIDNETFSLGGASGNTLARFVDGQLNDITFAETVGNGPNRFTLDTTAGYVFYYNGGRAVSYGSFAVSPAISAETTSPVSEPTSLVLFGTGLFLSIGLLYRTHSPCFTSKVHLPKV